MRRMEKISRLMKPLYVKRPKYRNRSGMCSANHWHQSILEADECSCLFLQQKAKAIKSYEIQKRFDFVVNEKKITTHLVDFYVTENNGKVYVIETKGMETELWRIKKKLFEALYPEIPYLVKKEAPSFFLRRDRYR